MDSAEFLPEFAAQAVADLERSAKQLRTRPEARHLAEASRRVAALLRDAVHVVLPDNGEIYRKNFGWVGAYSPPTPEECEAFAMPGPVTAFEYRWTNESGAPLTGTQDIGRKRITLVSDPNAGEPIPEGQRRVILFWSVYYSETARKWLLSRYMLPIAGPIKAAVEDGRWGLEIAAPIDLVGPAGSSDEALKTERPTDSPELRQALSEMMPDIAAVLQYGMAVRAGAQLEERVEKSRARRQRNERKGVGGFVYHVLVIPGSGSTGNAVAGAHASPRRHLRRAHLRKLPSGSWTFVRSCFVGSEDLGFVHKTYKVPKG